MAKAVDKTFKSKPAQSDPKDYRFDFVKAAPLFGGFSLLVTILSVVLFFTKGFNYGIDFAGGTEVQLKFNKPVASEDIRAALTDLHFGGEPSVQSLGTENEFLIRLGTPEGANDNERNSKLMANIEKLKTTFAQKFDLKPEGVLRVDTVGPQVGSELKKNGLLAAFYSLLVIMIYVSMRFDYSYAPGAVLCLIHDSVFTLGIFSLLGREVNVQIMAAVLTLIGYSLNDTIVTFDRIRETAPQNKDKTLGYIINKAINDMLGRTMLTAASTMLACLGLYLYGGGVIEDIAFTLLIGIVIGVYSSVYVAAPLIIVMEKLAPSHSMPHVEAKPA